MGGALSDSRDEEDGTDGPGHRDGLIAYHEGAGDSWGAEALKGISQTVNANRALSGASRTSPP